ncbi:hypothetical protein [Shouchella miscanthi]|uniref:Uncharacterized protein n=1 Tax=Shouchella miscanthi TaxID=2598861 RepID=A0ABU6NMM8_9BACI|nr:hypothetical protein [Shouchella miscanthi]MED4129453.1 hypothetical protein [Shouchella miscanthi]
MNINEFIKEVKDTNSLNSGVNLKELLKVIKSSVDKKSISQWLNELLKEDETNLSNIASLMEVHPLGFEKYVLWDNKDVRARLHYWKASKNMSHNTERIHDHRFNFGAIIIKGSYTQERYNHTFNHDGKINLELLSRDVFHEGDAYFFPAGQFHRIIPSSEVTASFLIRGHSMLPYSRVVDPDDLTISKRFGSVSKFKKNIERISNEFQEIAGDR